MGITLLILSLSGTMPVKKEILHILERGDANRSTDALITFNINTVDPLTVTTLQRGHYIDNFIRGSR